MTLSPSSRTNPERPSLSGLTQPSLLGNIVSDAFWPAATDDLLRGTGLDPLWWDVPVPPVLQNAGTPAPAAAVRPLPTRADQPLSTGRFAAGDPLCHGGGLASVEQDPHPAVQWGVPTPGGPAGIPPSQPPDPLASAVGRARTGRAAQGPRVAP